MLSTLAARIRPGSMACLIILSAITTLAAHAQTPELSRDERWRADLDHLVERMLEIHPEPFLQVSEVDFEAAVMELHQSIPDLKDHEVVVGLMRVIALIRDGHTGLRTSSIGMGFDQRYLVNLYPFEEGMFIQSAHRHYADYVGARVVRIGIVDVETAYGRAASVANGENDFTLLDRAPGLLRIPPVLHALGISNDLDSVTYEVEMADGSRHTFTATPDPLPPGPPFFVGLREYGDDIVHARANATDPTPLYLRHTDQHYWFEYLPEQRLVYMQFNRVRNGPHETISEFCARMFDFVDTHDVETFVLDIRFNHGGNNQLLRPLIHGFIKRDQTINRPGHLYTITGRGTFSAAMNCTAWMEEHTNTLFVGEPPGSAPNHFGDSDDIVLPYSGISGRVSAWRWQNGLPWDDRPWVAPDIPAPLTFAAYRENRDPAMEAILTHDNEPGLRVLLIQTYDADGVSTLATTYHAYKTRHPDLWGKTTEGEVNQLGYEFLQRGQLDAAITVLELNVESYPGSANTYDSLAEAHLESGDRERAIALYTRATEVDPEFENARRMLRQLTEGDAHTAAEGH